MDELAKAKHSNAIVHVLRKQVDAANQLQKQLPGWFESESALRNLSKVFSSNTELVAVLPKAVTLNGLYNTNVLAIMKMAKHIVEVFRSQPDCANPELVNQLARLPDIDKYFISFASKYCHFFVDSEHFAIYDSWACKALAFHHGCSRNWNLSDRNSNYPNYLAAINHLCESSSLQCSYSELDRYLWLKGQQLWFEKNRDVDPQKRIISMEMWDLYENPAKFNAQNLLDQLINQGHA